MAKKSTRSSRATAQSKQRPAKSEAATPEQPTSRRRARSKGHVVMPFGRTNYLLIGAGVLCIVVGYALMRMENEVDGFISLYVAPLIILAGYLEIIYAVVWRPKEK